MALIQLKCVNCNDNMHADESRERIFCGSCGAENLITQDVINVHNTATYNTQNIVNKTIIGREKSEAEDFIANGQTLLRIGEFEKAEKAFDEAIKLDAGDYRGWLGKAVAETEDFKEQYGILIMMY